MTLTQAAKDYNKERTKCLKDFKKYYITVTQDNLSKSDFLDNLLLTFNLQDSDFEFSKRLVTLLDGMKNKTNIIPPGRYLIYIKPK